MITYRELTEHGDHTLRYWQRYDEIAGIECVECNVQLLNLENEESN